MDKEKVNIKENIKTKEEYEKHWDAIKDIVSDLEKEFNKYLKEKGYDILNFTIQSTFHKHIKKNLQLLFACCDIDKGHFADLESKPFHGFLNKVVPKMNEEIQTGLIAVIYELAKIVDKYTQSIQEVEKEKGLKPNFEKE